MQCASHEGKMDARKILRHDVLSTQQALKVSKAVLILFYNDAVCSENDFSGLGKVGRGGKTKEMDTHG